MWIRPSTDSINHVDYLRNEPRWTTATCYCGHSFTNARLSCQSTAMSDDHFEAISLAVDCCGVVCDDDPDDINIADRLLFDLDALTGDHHCSMSTVARTEPQLVDPVATVPPTDTGSICNVGLCTPSTSELIAASSRLPRTLSSYSRESSRSFDTATDSDWMCGSTGRNTHCRQWE